VKHLCKPGGKGSRAMRRELGDKKGRRFGQVLRLLMAVVRSSPQAK
jgi:hypothetical protein